MECPREVVAMSESKQDKAHPARLTDEEVLTVVADWPGDLPALALALRRVVLKAAPIASEKIAFHSLVYYRAGEKYGVIGGNICGIGVKNETLILDFIHGASLPDPKKLLKGTAKAKRYVEIRNTADIRSASLRTLIMAAAEHRPIA